MFLNDSISEGSQLAGRLCARNLSAPLVLALTAESVPFADDIARSLGGVSDRIFVEGMAMSAATGRCGGAVCETGHLALEPASAVTEEDLAADMLNHIIRLVERRVAALPGNGPADSAGRNVILVADGLAGGATMVAAIRGVRAQHPLTLVAAVGVAPSRTLDRIRAEADETVALSAVANIGDVGRMRRSRRKAAPVPI